MRFRKNIIQIKDGEMGHVTWVKGWLQLHLS